MSAIVTRELTKAYKTHLGRTAPPSLDGLDLVVNEREVFGFLGRNGAGKTTAIKLLCSLIRPTRGEAWILDRNVREAQARRVIGYLPENPYFYEYLTPRETLDFYGRLNNESSSSRADEWEKLSDLLELRDIADQRVREFSKGMRQRLAFAVALVGDPKILILDEPMSGLDPLGRRSTRELILRLRGEKKTIFFSSHVLSDVEQVCDRVGILVKGRLTVTGRLDQLLTTHVESVEVVATGLTPSADEAIAAKSVRTRASEAGRHYYMSDLDAANAAVRMVHANGGKIVEFTPVRESLEDYFYRQQENKP